ncbi:hypothetical protein EDE08_104156 [Bradyrhizobium sp. R2.2-H]|jgi:hypothetical protein|uniref:hypothetical protein n=1 Tax=unclassified Bradyrhizobium TaxID=2631580 RepID=UPI00104DB031|nr:MULTISPECIES: hypothetical protein [unclassified Bradyrhizobium]TCU73817.1 hypothetical protein EDE10_104486 [Bradyrhizobium sp. Y-H1]TCU75993.1 hypothetical protein EDE08_104156 [Bradyrhizobium sp. R2.2-H]
MSLLQAAVASFGLYLLLQIAVIPKLHARMLGAKATNAFALIATMLVAELARAATLIITASLGLILGSLWLVPKITSYGSQKHWAQTFEFLRHIREQIEHIDKWWGIATIGVLGLALLIAGRHEAKRRASDAIEAAFEKLKSDIEKTGLAPLPPTPEMRALEIEIEKRRSRVAEISSATDQHSSAETDSQQNSELAKLNSEIEALDNWHTHLDITRRLDVGSAIADIVQPQKKKSEKSHPWLLSAGFFKIISFSSRALTIASLTLLIPALVAIASGEISEAAQSAIVRIHDLILKQTIKEAEDTWSRALELQSQKRELTKADDALIDQLAGQFQAYVQQQNSGLMRGSIEVGRRLAQNAARERILQNFAASKPSTIVKGAATQQGVESEIAKEIVKTNSNERLGGTNLREQFKNELTEQAKAAKPQAWEAFRAKAAQALRSARAPLESSEIASKLFAEALNTLSQTVINTDDASKALSHIASGLGKPGDTAERANELRKLNRDRFLNEISAHSAFGSPHSPLVPGTNIAVQNPALEETIKRMAGRMETQLAGADRLWRDSPPTIERFSGDGQDLNAARQQIEKLMASKSVPPNLARELPNSLATYADYFPGQIGEETRTHRAKLIKSTPAFNAAVEGRAIATAENFARARSYGALRGFAKVGGVLIGLKPNGGEAPIIIDLSWSESDRGLQFALRRADQRILSFGPFRAEIVRLALAYAADGRPVTVTLPAAGIGRGVLLHPALVDTSLGCKARHLDQFVDAFTSRSPERTSATQRVDQHLDTYRFAWAAQFQQIMATTADVLSKDELQSLEPVKEFSTKVLSSEEISKSVATTIKSPKEWADKRLSPVTLKTDYFEAGLVKTISSCLGTSGSPAAFRQCVAMTPIDVAFIRSGKWTAGPPSLFSESGVRETNYVLDDQLSFLDLRSAKGATWPFEFMLQVTFETPRYFAEERSTLSFDETPFEYPNVKAWISDRVSKGIAADRSPLQTEKTMVDLREFAVLQRFFRLALDGTFGDGFPLDTLVRLSQIKSRAQQPVVRTPLWNSPDATAKILSQNQLASLIEPLGLSRDMQFATPQNEACPDIQP